MTKKVDVHIRSREDPEDVWSNNGTSISYKKANSTITFKDFKSIFFQENNKILYEKSIKESINSFLNENNITIFAYGQTGSGKTHTMTGNENEAGIVQLSLKKIYNSNKNYLISCVEIYNEKIFDLSNNSEVKMYNLSGKNIIKNLYVENADTIEKATEFLEKCANNRKVGITEYNINSSRSHSIIQITYKNSTLNFIDLAGSERASRYESRRSEGSYINKSLLALGTLVNNLLNNKMLGFRDSQLTRILQSSFEGNTQLIALCMISPLKNCIEESLSTLNFAARLSNIDLKGHEEVILEQKEKIVFVNNSKDILKPTFCPKNKVLLSLNNNELYNSINSKEWKEDIISEYFSENINNKEINSDLLEVLEMYTMRISSLETIILELLEKNQNKQIREKFEYEKEMFDMQKDICEVLLSEKPFKNK